MAQLKNHLDRAVSRWNAGDLEGYLTLYDDSIRLHGYAPQPMNKTEVAGFYRMIHATLSPPGQPSPRLTVHEMVESGDLISCRVTMTGTHTGPFMNIPATGRPYALPGITILRFSGEKTIERWACADMLGLLVQIGAVPPPGGAAKKLR